MAKPKSFAGVRRLAAGGYIRRARRERSLIYTDVDEPTVPSLVLITLRVVIDRDAHAQEDALRLSARWSAAAIGEQAGHLCDQTVEFEGLGIELVTARRERLLALASKRVSRKGDHGNVAGFGIALKSAGCLPAIDDWHLQIHQNDVRPLSDRHLAASLAILRGHHLEITQ